LNILLPTSQLQKTFNNQEKLVKKHGHLRAKIIRRRLDDLRAVTCLDDMRQLPGRCHQLKGDHAGQFAIDLDGLNRLIFEPTAPVPRNPDGGIDWSQVTSISIVGVEDYHE
jgi:proteic killer suppression protein